MTPGSRHCGAGLADGLELGLLERENQLGGRGRGQSHRAGRYPQAPCTCEAAFTGDREIARLADRNDAHITPGEDLGRNVVDVAPGYLFEPAPGLLDPDRVTIELQRRLATHRIERKLRGSKNHDCGKCQHSETAAVIPQLA